MAVTLVQLSDLHLDDGNPFFGDAVRRAVAHVNRLTPEPIAVIVTGDLTDGGTPTEYAAVRPLLAELRVPVYVLPGNHDDRAAMRAGLDLPGAADEPIRDVAELGDLRVVLADTTKPGADDGQLDLEWIAAQLSADPATPTILAVHHPPLLLGVDGIDDIGLSDADHAGLAALLADHPQVQLVTGGHVHRAASGVLGGCRVVSAPSTGHQLILNFQTDQLGIDEAEPAGFLIHALVRGRLVTHVQPVLG